MLSCVVYGLPDVPIQVLVVTVDIAGRFIELAYITTYLIYAPKNTRVHTSVTQPDPFSTFLNCGQQLLQDNLHYNLQQVWSDAIFV
jgi:hypothetical protein